MSDEVKLTSAEKETFLGDVIASASRTLHIRHIEREAKLVAETQRADDAQRRAETLGTELDLLRTISRHAIDELKVKLAGAESQCRELAAAAFEHITCIWCKLTFANRADWLSGLSDGLGQAHFKICANNPARKLESECTRLENELSRFRALCGDVGSARELTGVQWREACIKAETERDSLRDELKRVRTTPPSGFYEKSYSTKFMEDLADIKYRLKEVENEMRNQKSKNES
jgi:hypothetical protein